jgi:hypothetical protein
MTESPPDENNPVPQESDPEESNPAGEADDKRERNAAPGKVARFQAQGYAFVSMLRGFLSLVSLIHS